MTPLDLNLSFSGSSSASAAQDLRGAYSNVFGDVITGGGKKPTSEMVQLAALIALAAVALVFVLRR